MDKSAETPVFSKASVANWFDEKEQLWKVTPTPDTALADCVARFDGPVNEARPGQPIPIYRNYEVEPPLEDLNLVDLAAKLNPDQNEFIRRTIIELLSIGLK